MDKVYKNLSLIAAIGKNNELGKDNTLIWRFKEDMKFFKENTIGNPIIMGRKTLESLPKLLPGREHIVLTKSNIDIEGVQVFHSKEEVLEYVSKMDQTFNVIGGASIYEQFIENVDSMLLTEIDAEAPADVYFPNFDKDEWYRKDLYEAFDGPIHYTHVLYKRK